MRTILISIILLFTITISNAQSLSNTVWTYTQRIYGLEETQKITSCFVFTSQTEVIWLFETPHNYVFPVGIGSYDEQRQTITFSHTKPYHKTISIYYQDTTIKFEFIVHPNNEADLRLCNEDEVLKLFYNDGGMCNLSKEKYTLQPNSNLVETCWGYNTDGESGFIYFKSKYEVLLNGKSHLYVSFGNNVFIKSGDNLNNENMVGSVNGNKIYLHRDGLDVHSSENIYQITLEKIE